MAYKVSSILTSFIADTIGGSYLAAGSLMLYTGVPPASVEDAVTGDLLIIIGTAGVGTVGMFDWEAASNGTAVLKNGVIGTAIDDGTFGYGRLGYFDAGGDVYYIQGYAGTAATCDFVLNSLYSTTGEVSTCGTCDIIVPMS